jgi:hypothetical protein
MIPRGYKLGKKISHVDVLPGFRIRLAYKDGYVGELDFWPYIEWGEAMVPLKDARLFASAHVGSGGASLEWIGPDGEQIDFDADGLRMDLEGLRQAPLRQTEAG